MPCFLHHPSRITGAPDGRQSCGCSRPIRLRRCCRCCLLPLRSVPPRPPLARGCHPTQAAAGWQGTAATASRRPVHAAGVACRGLAATRCSRRLPQVPLFAGPPRPLLLLPPPPAAAGAGAHRTPGSPPAAVCRCCHLAAHVCQELQPAAALQPLLVELAVAGSRWAATQLRRDPAPPAAAAAARTRCCPGCCCCCHGLLAPWPAVGSSPGRRGRGAGPAAVAPLRCQARWQPPAGPRHRLAQTQPSWPPAAAARGAPGRLCSTGARRRRRRRWRGIGRSW